MQWLFQGKQMRSVLLVTGCLAVLGAGGVYLYRDPRVRDLFRPVAPERKIVSAPAVSATPAPTDAATRRPRRAIRTPQASRPAEVEPEPVTVPNQTPNATVARVLMQILAAKRLGEEIRIVVSDTTVMVTGTADTDDQRQKILQTIEKGREARRIDAAGLIVRR
jgi:hypothetical protein